MYQQACARDGSTPDLWRTGVLFPLIRQYHRLAKSPYLDIHHKTRSVYIHVPKTGGNSITNILYNRRSKHAGSHRAAWEYQAFNAELFDSYYVFTMVRHPLRRMRSAFYYLKNGGMNATDKAFGDTVLAPYGTFLDFVAAVKTDAGLRAQVMGWLHFLPQSYFLCSPGGECIVPHICRLENFDAELSRVCAQIGVGFTPRRDNPTPRHRVPEEDLSGAPEDICYDLYSQDYELLGYNKVPQ